MMDLEVLRGRIQRYIGLHLHQAACYWADKAYSLSGHATEDLVTLAQCYLLTSQPQRAVQLLKLSGRQRSDAQCRYLAARALYDTRAYQEALVALQPEALESGGTALLDVDDVTGDGTEPAHLLLLKGRVYEALQNRPAAAQCFRAALLADVMCHEALDALVGHQMLTLEEERQLLDDLPLEDQLMAGDAVSVRQLYTLQLKKYTSPDMEEAAEVMQHVPPPLGQNHDVLVCMAERHYYNCDYAACYELTSTVLEADPDHTLCLPIHIACLLEKRNINALFQLSHRLVDSYPEAALAWFAVGCYYYTVGKMDPARRYLSKATTLDPLFGPAWLAYGHSFALENEHDQAISAYFRANQLMRGCHLPLLYVGLEYGFTNNGRLAQQFFCQALEIAPDDPFVLHELGTLLFQGRDYAGAERHLAAALERVQRTSHTVPADRWEPLLNNLGHCYRKLGRYDEALDAYQKALVLDPGNAGTYSAIGFTHALMEHYSEAVDVFHKALSIRRDDAFSTQMLSSVLEQLLANQVVVDQPYIMLVEHDPPVTPVRTGPPIVTPGTPGPPPLTDHTDISIKMDSSDDMSLDLDTTR